MTIALDRRSFAVWDVAAHDWLVEAGAFEVVVARSSVDPVAVLAHEVDSPDRRHPGRRTRPASSPPTTSSRPCSAAPSPPVPPARPFHRNSTLEDLETSRPRSGRSAPRSCGRASARPQQEFPDPDEATLAMVRIALREGPVRALVLLSRGTVRFAEVDALLAALNREWGASAGAVRTAVRQRLR